MRNGNPLALWCRLGLAVLCVFVVRATPAESTRDWTVRDSIAVRYVVSDQELPGSLGLADFSKSIVVSPDGRHFFFVTRSGDLACDCNRYELKVFAVNDVKGSIGRAGSAMPEALCSVVMQSSRGEGYEGIREARWLDARTVAFLGVEGVNSREVYRLDIESRKTQKLTEGSADVEAYSIQHDLVLHTRLFKEPKKVLDRYPVVPVAGTELDELLGAYDGHYELFAAAGGRHATRLASSLSHDFSSWPAPNGRFAVVAFGPDEERKEWEAYEFGRPGLKIWGARGRFLLLDTQSGAMQTMIDAPIGKATRYGWYTAPTALWSPDGSKVVLVNTALPLSEDPEQRRNTSFIVEYDVRTGRWTQVDALFGGASHLSVDAVRWATAAWLEPGRRFLVTYTAQSGENPQQPRYGRVGGAVYTRTAKGWTVKPAPDTVNIPALPAAALRKDLKVFVRQSANDPPMVMASTAAGEAPLTPADPVLDRAWRARMEPVRWQERDGREAHGGLLLPRSREGAEPPPLVIQAYHYEPNIFWPDGSAATAYAAQPLVGAGFAVLFMQIPGVDQPDVAGTLAEGVGFVERIDAAVTALSERGLIDAKRVGLVGFSRGGFLTYYAVTHPGTTQLRAAIDADGWTASYGEYVINAAISAPGGASNRTFEAQYGGTGTFWRNKERWLEHAPAFNVDRARTPILFTGNKQAGALWNVETVGAFRLNRRPFELQIFPDGDHQLQRPRERLASLEATVDWMGFWLLEREDAAPEKSEQYARWRKIRSDWQTVQGEEDSAAQRSRTTHGSR